MKIFLALFLSFVFHLAVFLYFMQHETITKEEFSEQNQTTVKFVNLVKQSQSQPQKEQKQKQKQIIQADKLPKNDILNEAPSKQIIEDLPPLKNPIKEKIEPKEPLKEEMKKKEQFDDITKSYLELYKDDFDKLSDETKVYLIKNLKDIGKITERFLIYPHIGIQARQQGINVVEFILYPDGKISKPKIIKSSKYFILDDNTEETILKAYRDYPRPQKPSVIRIYVKYVII